MSTIFFSGINRCACFGQFSRNNLHLREDQSTVRSICRRGLALAMTKIARLTTTSANPLLAEQPSLTIK